MSVSMTMNGAVLPVLAMYIVAAEEQVSVCGGGGEGVCVVVCACVCVCVLLHMHLSIMHKKTWMGISGC